MAKLGVNGMRQITQLIDEKGDNVLKALNSEISVHMDVIRDRMLADKGYPMNSDQLKMELRRLQHLQDDVEYGDDEVLESLQNQKRNIDDEIAAKVESMRARVEAEVERIRAALNEEVRAVKSSKMERVTEMNRAIAARQNKLIDAVHPGLSEQIATISAEVESVGKLERSMTRDVEAAVDNISRNRSRLMHLVRDSVSAAKIGLLGCETTEQAKVFLDRIPTVAELIHVVESPEAGGLAALVDRLQPSHTIMISAPQPAPEDELPIVDPEKTEVTGTVRMADIQFETEDA